MAIFASTTLGSSDPARAMNIKALEARAQALAATQAKQELPTSMPSPWQGAGYLANTVADAVLTKRADQQAQQQRQQLGDIMSQVGPQGPNPQQLAGITTRDTDLGKMYAQQAFAARQSTEELAARKEAAAQKAQADQAYLAEQDRLSQAHPQSDIGKLTADVGRKPTEEEIAAEIRKKTMPSPADQAAIGKAQTENIDLQTTQAQLKEAADLLNSGKVYSDAGAGLRTDYGQNVPKVLRGIAGVSEEQTAASKRVKQILSAEVVQTLKSIKGPASNKDMDWATSTVNDPTAPLENKKRAMGILQAQMNAHLQSSEQTLKSMGGTPVKVDIPATGATAAPAAGGPQSVASEAEALALPPGTKFKLPDGRTGTAR